MLTSEFGAWPMHESERQHYKYYKLDRWEDMQRRRLRFVKNQYGTSHLDATLRPGSAEGVLCFALHDVLFNKMLILNDDLMQSCCKQ